MCHPQFVMNVSTVYYRETFSELNMNNCLKSNELIFQVFWIADHHHTNVQKKIIEDQHFKPICDVI